MKRKIALENVCSHCRKLFGKKSNQTHTHSHEIFHSLPFIVSFAAVIRVVTQRFSPTKRCVTTLITAAKESIPFTAETHFLH